MHRQAEKPILTRKPRQQAAKARAAREKAIEAASRRCGTAGILEPLALRRCTPWSGEKGPMAQPQNKTQAGTSPTPTAISMKSDSHYIQGYNCPSLAGQRLPR